MKSLFTQIEDNNLLVYTYEVISTKSERKSMLVQKEQYVKIYLYTSGLIYIHQDLLIQIKIDLYNNITIYA